MLDAINGQLSTHGGHFITQGRAVIDSTNNGIFSLPLCLCLAAILVRLLKGKKAKFFTSLYGWSTVKAKMYETNL